MAGKTRAHHCANCSAPLKVALGEVEVFCDLCDSHLKIAPSEAELEVIRTREEMKYRERVKSFLASGARASVPGEDLREPFPAHRADLGSLGTDGLIRSDC